MSGHAADRTVSRGTLLRWLGWFGLLNGCLAGLVGLRYMFVFGVPDSALAGLYIFSAYVAHFATLGFLPLMLLLGPVVLLVPRRGLIMGLGVLFAAIMIVLIVLDTNIFAQYRYHISRLTVEIFDTSTWLFAGILLLVMLAFQVLFAANVWQHVAAKPGGKGVWLAALLSLVWLAGQGLHIWADATAYSPATSFNRFLPAYYPIKAKRRLAKLGWVDPAVVERQRLLRKAGAGLDGQNSQLRYPLKPMVCNAERPLPDVLLILVDALRPDMISAELTPRIAAFAAGSQDFANHFSGGNSSRMGIFSMFYGLPSTYWQSVYDLQQPPVLINVLAANDYQFAGFSSVGFGSPAQIDRTVFAGVDPDALWAPGADDADRNQAITQQWLDWFGKNQDSSQPFFGFLYYDPGNVAALVSQAVATESAVAEKLSNYRNGVSAVDQEIAIILEQLSSVERERSIVVLIASDHGYEFDELGLGYVGHASNYGRYQLKSTLLIDWPGREPQRYMHRTAHQDLPATLLNDLYGCENPAADFSSGNNLFAEESWEWFIAGSYNSHAIVEPDKVVVTYPGGMIDLLDNSYRPSAELQLDPGRIEQALVEMRRFYH